MICLKDILRSVYNILIDGMTGTAFACITKSEKCVLLTCQHMIPETICTGEKMDFNVIGYRNLVTLSGTVLRNEHRKDLAAIFIESDVSLNGIKIDALTEDIFYSVGDEVIAVGFPFLSNCADISFFPFLDNDKFFPQGLLKHGYISGLISSVKNGHRILLDLHNNKGFSGGPVFCKKLLPGKTEPDYTMVGLLSGFYCDSFDDGICIESNSGIAYAYDTRFLLRQIESFESEMRESD